MSSLINVFDTIPPLASPIYSVSVTSNVSVQIIWGNNAALNLGTYQLFRLNQRTGNWDNIYTDYDPKNSGFSVTSSYIDSGLKPVKIHTLINCWLRTYAERPSGLTGLLPILPLILPLKPWVTISWFTGLLMKDVQSAITVYTERIRDPCLTTLPLYLQTHFSTTPHCIARICILTR